jgi:hypothetical protein
MQNALTGYICGANGLILKTTNGGVVGIKPVNDEIPGHFVLYQNYPNPFNPKTKIRFDIPKTPLNPPFNQREEERNGGGFVTLKIYDILGCEIATLINQQLQPGTYEYDWEGTNYPGGVYYYKLISNNFSDCKKMVLIK